MTRRILVVGGDDPSGAAGVAVDRETVQALGAACRVVVTARTDQDDREVRSVGARDPARWFEEARASVASWCEDAALDGLKFGLLPGADHLHAAARLVRELRARWPALPVVLDPVLASSSGFTFLDDAACDALRGELIPLVVLTPNLPEAARLSGLAPEDLLADLDARIAALCALTAAGTRGIVLKGGHASEHPARDLVLEPGSPPAWIEQERIAGPGIRGSGCRHASALTTGLASGRGLLEAARGAAALVAACIARG